MDIKPHVDIKKKQMAIAAEAASGGEWAYVHKLFAVLAKKWSVSILLTLFPGQLRFSEIQKEMQCTNTKTLTLTLKLLEEEGLIGREVLDTRPPGVQYGLTESGRSLAEQLYPLWKWINDRCD
ncbi:helix-turn-helix transcriptional regulator [Streptomyces sp. NA04227]|uniref:winged helix-turn-helix transcriptional regulator n=1 Tax=Streptomyces sp. NA04227 TaxID=2742136 RepID=UPI0015924763|nr:helix-turn-helix domain-containing protein [Streptomyces sp. NA04227]QKW09788.1 helix-turn-helix transcriptional regulator [Streptomyces sp. NA04227]